MFDFFLVKTFYGNTIAQWSLASVLILLSVVAGKILYWLSGNYLKKLTEKTETELDDILVDMAEEPVILAGVLTAIWFAIGVLTLPTIVTLWVYRIFYILIVINVAWLITRTVDSLIECYLVPIAAKTESDLDDMLIPIVRNTFKTLVWVLSIIIGLNNAGYNVGAILTGLGIGGLAVAMAARDTLSNVFGGATILITRPFKIGDRIEVGDTNGWVKSIGLRSTLISDFYGHMITVPNKIFTESNIKNIDARSCYYINMKLRLKFDTTYDKITEAMEILEQITRDNELIVDNYWVGLDTIGEYSIDINYWYGVKIWQSDEKDSIPDWYTKLALGKSQVNLEIIKRFESSGIKLAFPVVAKVQEQGLPAGEGIF